MIRTLRTLLDEPRAPEPRGPQPGDWILAGLVAIVALVEGRLNPPEVWPALSVVVTAALAFVLPWRRVHPLRVVAIAFGTTGVLHGTAALMDLRWDGLDTGVFLLILPYALLRWASGREALAGLALTALSFATAMWNEQHGWGEILGASLFLLFPAALGASVRYQDSAARRGREQVRANEREQLARELHDTVAHHVSAIAIQAQAGRALAATRAEAPLEALAVIEEAASRTLTDMRRIVGALRREGEEAELSPMAGLHDLAAFHDETSRPAVSVSMTVLPADLDAALQATLFRLAQEALTNARRHASGATRVEIRVERSRDAVTLTVADDGAPVPAGIEPGFGIRGMAERAALLGGTLSAAPGANGGWVVAAVLPCGEKS